MGVGDQNNKIDDFTLVVSSIAVLLLLVVAVAKTTPPFSSLTASSAFYIGLLMLIFVLLHLSGERNVTGETLMSVFNASPTEGDMWMNPHAQPSSQKNDLTEAELRSLLDEDIERAADESVPVGWLLSLSSILLFSAVYSQFHPIPSQFYGLLLNSGGGLLLAVNFAHGVGVVSTSPEYRTKQFFQNFWGALLLASGFLLQLATLVSM